MEAKMSDINVTKRTIAKGIYLLRFRTQYELAATLMRMQEHYESPRFHGQIFSAEQFMDWYAGQYGNFTYYQDWVGFNIPSTALKPFYEGKFNPLSEKEKQFLRLFKDVKKRFYVIGVYRGDAEGSLTHELAHALFFLDDSYRQSVCEAMRGYNTAKLSKLIAKAGYAKHVIRDEAQAYLIAPSGDFGVDPALRPLRQALRKLFRAQCKKLSIPKIS
jgi:hypothetical protein